MGILNQDRIYCLLKDPHWTFIWWELSRQTCDELFPSTTEATTSSAAGTSREVTRPQLLLRVHDITDIYFDGHNSHHVFNVGTVQARGEWYLHIPVSNRVYCAELGVSADGSGFRSVIISRPLYLPRDHPSDHIEECWGTIELCS
jgi:hypothetical protein